MGKEREITSNLMFKSRGRTAGMVLVLFIPILTVCLAFPRPASARSYTIDKVTIDATINEDGSLDVTEDRMFDFNGSFNGVYWDIPDRNSDGSDLGLEIKSAGIVEGGKFQPFENVSGGDDRTVTTYSRYNGSTSVVRATLYCKQSNAIVTYRINYTVARGVQAHKDVGVLYWKFVSDGWDMPSNNVRCTIHLPVPNDDTLRPKDNVWMWAHGPLNGHIEAQDDDVVMTVPQVGTKEYAETRIMFPVNWLSEATPDSREVFESIRTEEDSWTSRTNLRRNILFTLYRAVNVVPVVLLAATAALAVWTKRRYKNAHKAQFQEDYFRDVPTDDHPSVLGALMQDGEADSDDLVAALMRLTDKHVVGLDLVTTTRRGFLGREREEKDYRLVAVPSVDSNELDAIDRATIQFLFRDVARKAEHHEVNADGSESFLISDMKDVAKDYPSSYDSALNSWHEAVRGECNKRHFFDDETKYGKGGLIGLGIVDLILGVAIIIVSALLDNTLGFPLGGATFMAGIVTLFFSSSMDKLSPEAVEIRAKLEALKRWFKDFTRLREAIPTDVVLWNRLLVMAVVLGVAEEVIKQLKVAAPQVLTDTNFHGHVWYDTYAGERSAFSTVRDGFTTAAAVSASELSESSSSGGGGGFSGGGGGGFGGGGGGGAF